MSPSQQEKVGLKQVIGSVLASFLGVQRGERYERDFTHGKPHHYIVVGLIGTVLFILTVVGVVKLVLWFAGV
jgi:hypothetical protein